MLAVRNIAHILYLAEQGLLDCDPELMGDRGNIIPNEVINEWQKLDRIELECLRKLLCKKRSSYQPVPISRTQIVAMTRANIQLAKKWLPVQLISETLPQRWQSFLDLSQDKKDEH